MSGKQFGTRRPTQTTERRRAKRDALGIAVSLYSVSQSRVVLMLDASQTGARLGGQNLPANGKEVLLKAGDVELFGIIVRSADGEAAIKFDRPTGPEELERLQSLLSEQMQVTILHAR